MYVEKDKTEERYMFDGLFICQHLSTLRFCLNTKIFYQNHFWMIHLEVSIIHSFHIATSTKPDENFQLNEKLSIIIISHKNNFDKIVLYSDKTLKSKGFRE